MLTVHSQQYEQGYVHPQYFNNQSPQPVQSQIAATQDTSTIEKLKKQAKKLKKKLEKLSIREIHNKNTVFSMDKLLQEYSQKYKEIK